jgi:hypothetical protein
MSEMGLPRQRPNFAALGNVAMGHKLTFHAGRNHKPLITLARRVTPWPASSPSLGEVVDNPDAPPERPRVGVGAQANAAFCDPC